MYDELIKQLRYCAINECMHEGEKIVGCTAPYEQREGCFTCNDVLMIKAADAIEELWKMFQSAEKDNAKLTARYVEKCNKVPKWIPIAERLPEKDQEVLVCVSNEFHPKDKWIAVDWIYEQGWQQHDIVSHWMPLPEPPESEGE